MGIDQYRVEPSPFERYYDVFLRNALVGQRYLIKLSSGETAKGVPTSGSIVNPFDPTVSFAFHEDSGQQYKIPFAELKEAVAVPADRTIGTVRTVDENTLAGGDLFVSIGLADARSLYAADSPITVAVVLEPNAPFSNNASPGTYKFLTVGGAAFRIVGINQRDPRVLELTVDPA
jgi:hypothetical protein